MDGSLGLPSPSHDDGSTKPPRLPRRDHYPIPSPAVTCHTQAALSTDAKPKSKATLEVKTRDSLARAVVTLRAGKVEHASIDLVIDEQVVFSAVGDADIHLTGYHMPEFEGEEGTAGGEGRGTDLGGAAVSARGSGSRASCECGVHTRWVCTLHDPDRPTTALCEAR